MFSKIYRSQHYFRKCFYVGCNYYGGLKCIDHSFAYVDHNCFFVGLIIHEFWWGVLWVWSSALDDPISGGAGPRIEPWATLQQAGALSTEPRQTPHPVITYVYRQSHGTNRPCISNFGMVGLHRACYDLYFTHTIILLYPYIVTLPSRHFPQEFPWAGNHIEPSHSLIIWVSI